MNIKKSLASAAMQNWYDYITIMKDVVPQGHIEELMLVTNDKEAAVAATVINKDDNGNDNQETNFNHRVTVNYIMPDKLMDDLHASIENLYVSHIKNRYGCEAKRFESIQFLGYPVGGHYIKHNDSETYFDGKWDRMAPRDISLIFYLNEEFGGGELEFPDLGLTIKPKRGMMVAFPSYKEFAHKVHPVTWGYRYSLVSWIETEKRIYG